MNLTQTPAGEVVAPEGPSQRLGRLLPDLARLLESAPAPAEFYGEFLQRVVPAAGGFAGAVWARTPQGQFRIEHQANLSRVGLEAAPGGRACHAELLRELARRDRPLWVPPHSGADTKDGRPAPANLTDFGLLLAPVLVERQLIGAVEVWLEPDRPPEVRKAGARLLGEAGGVVAAFLHKAHWRQLHEQQELWAGLEEFARQVHGSLDPREVAYLVANQGRVLAGCDQVSVAVLAGTAARVEAVSGAQAVEAGSRLVRAMQALFEQAMRWGERLAYGGTRDEGLPPAVRQALDAYLAESHARALVLLPLRDARAGGGAGPARCAVLAESFGPDVSAEQLEARLAPVARHAAPALHNALAYRRAASGRLPWPLAGAWDWVAGRRARKVLAALAALLLAVAALAVVPAPLRVEARGQLLPKDCRTVYAHLSGRVVDVKAQHGDRVEKGQELLHLEDLELQLKAEQLHHAVHFAEQRLAVLGEQLAKAAGGEERNTLVRERIEREYELRKATVEREVLLHGSRQPRKAPVPAPLAGTVVTFDARQQLAGKTVKPGDPLLRVARVQGPWEVELLLPERAIAAVREGLRRSADGELDVELLLASHPLRSFQGRLGRDGLGGEAAVRDGEVVLPARVRLPDPGLAGQLPTLPVGLEVRAKVDCGRRAAGYAWFGDLVEFFYEHVLF